MVSGITGAAGSSRSAEDNDTKHDRFVDKLDEVDEKMWICQIVKCRSKG